MLANLVPSVELTGGPWFTDNELDVEFVGALKRICHKIIQKEVRRIEIAVSSGELTRDRTTVYAETWRERGQATTESHH